MPPRHAGAEGQPALLAIRAEVTYDDLHLTGAGYREWYGLLEEHLRA